MVSHTLELITCIILTIALTASPASEADESKVIRWQELKSLTFSPSDRMTIGSKIRRKITITKPVIVTRGGEKLSEQRKLPLHLKQDIFCRVLHAVNYSDADESWPPLKWDCSSEELLEDFIITESKVECECYKHCSGDEVLIPSCHVTLRVDDPPFELSLISLPVYLFFLAFAAAYGFWCQCYFLKRRNEQDHQRKQESKFLKRRTTRLPPHFYFPTNSGFQA